jgi:predicted RNA-binding protein
MKMCEAAAYLLKDGEEELLMESVDQLESEANQIKIINIFGEQKKVKAKIKALSLVDHKIVLEPI